MRSRHHSTLFSANGRRKYLCARELSRFLAATRNTDDETNVFCSLLAYTGCRISEALGLTLAQLDREAGLVVFRTLKRREQVFRAVPVPHDLMRALCRIAAGRAPDAPLWPWCRQTAWRRVKSVMDAAKIAGAHAMPKGLRHGFGVANAEHKVPMATTQKWLGHSNLETTAIYQQATGREERALAARLWRNLRA
jgi:integrase/recombinase XerD